jgi:signal transduction histidine kinase
MGALKQPLAKRILLAVVGMHALLLPLLYFGIAWNIQRNQADAFVNHARAFSRTLVEELEAGSVGMGDANLEQFLDGLVLGGEINFVEYQLGNRVYRSALLGKRQWPANSSNEIQFGEGADRTYYLAATVQYGQRIGTLRLGFDESGTYETIQSTLQGVLTALAMYLLGVLAVAYLLGRRIIESLQQLQVASRRVAGGEHSLPLQTTSDIREIDALAQDLESMRRELVGASVRLAAHIEEREQLESRLRQKQRIETVGTLAGGLAHEFNNVLVPITLFGQLAMDSIPPDHPAHADMLRMMGAVARATSVAGKILTFGRHEGDTETRIIDINDAVREAIELFSALCPADVRMLVSLEEGCDPILADPTLIVQVVMNLCTNSLQAMRPAGGDLWISTRTIGTGDTASGRGPTARYVELTVEDTGQGMDAETLDRIYEPFFTRREVGQGTGLGLSIVHGIVTSLRGTIQVQSSPGRGTVFHVLLASATSSNSVQDTADDVHNSR